MSTWRITDIYFSTSIDELFDANGNFDDGPVLAENKIQFNYTPVNSNLSGHPNSVSAKPGLYQTSYLESIEGFNQKLELVLIEDDEADHIFYNYIQVNSGINIDVERKRIDKIKLYEKEIGTSNSFHVRTIDFNYNHPAADKRYYLEELAFQNAAGAVIEKYQFTYDNPENFPAFHDPQIVTASYENMNGYYSIANLNINERNNRTDHVEYGQLTEIIYPSGKIETIVYENYEVLFASNSRPYQGPPFEGISLRIATSSGGFEYSDDAYFPGFWPDNPSWDDDLKYTYSRVYQITTASPYDPANFRLEEAYTYGDYEFAGLPVNIILDEMRFEDSSGDDSRVDEFLASSNDRYIFMTRKNPAEVFYRSITRTINQREEIYTKYAPISGDPGPFPNTLPKHIYVNAGGDNVFYVSFNNFMWSRLGKVEENKITDLTSNDYTREILTYQFALPASNTQLFIDGENIYGSGPYPYGLQFWNPVFNLRRTESYVNTAKISDAYYIYDTSHKMGNVLRTQIDWRHNFAINSKATPATPNPTEQYFLETGLRYAFEEYSQMPSRNIIPLRVEERRDIYLRTDISNPGSGTATFIGNKIFTYRLFNNKIWELDYVYQHNTGNYVPFNFSDPESNEPGYSLVEHHQYRLSYGNDWVVYKPNYFIKYYYAQDPEYPFSDDYQSPGHRMTGIGLLSNFEYIQTEEAGDAATVIGDHDFLYAFSYDDFGHLTELRREYNGLTWTFDYDDKLRLESKALNGQIVHEYSYELATDIGNTTNLNKIITTSYYSPSKSVQEVKYIDGVMGELQILNGVDQDFIAVENIFDNLMRPVGATKPVNYTTSELELQDIVGNLNVITDPLTQINSGDLSSFFPGGDGPYAYTLMVKDLLELDIKNYLPGQYMRSNDVKSTLSTAYIDEKYRQNLTVDQDGIELYDLFNLSSLKFYSGNNDDHHTYFVYNPKSELRKVYHPDNRVSEYLYNHHGNMVAKETPDQAAKVIAGNEDDIFTNPDFRFLYDDFGKLRFSIDPNQSFQNIMEYTKYDIYNRIIEMGQISSVGNFTSTKANNPNFPENGDWLVKNYYDEEFSLAGFTNQLTKTRLSKRVEIIGDETYTTIYSYNTEGYLARVREESPAGIKDEYYLDYDQLGNLLEFEVRLNEIIIQHFWYEYDLLGRLNKVYFDNSETRPLDPTAIHTYDADGNIKTFDLSNGMQRVDYSYNILGWLTDINDINSLGNDAFAQKLHYWNNLPTGINARYNGNIAAIESITPFHSSNILTIGFDYDHLNRLESSVSFGVFADDFNCSYQYDIMGNFQNIERYREGNLIDDLSYQYDGNKITAVIDAIASSLYEGDFDSQGNGSYQYDANGNMLSDENRGLVSLAYNILDLPNLIEKSDGTIVEYAYNISGLRMIKKINSDIKSRYLRLTDGRIAAELNDSENKAIYFGFSAPAGEGLKIEYSGHIETILSNGNPVSTSKIFTPQEMASGVSFKPSGTSPVSITSFSIGNASVIEYVNIYGAKEDIIGQRRFKDEQQPEDFYYLKDHLFNIRAQIRDDGANGEVVASNDYYPYGALMRNGIGPIFEEDDKFKFQGKERDRESGIDYVGARFYDAGIGVFRSIDPQVNNFPNSSPYVYASNNPIILIDPNGEAWFYYQAQGDSIERWHWHNSDYIITRDQFGELGILAGIVDQFIEENGNYYYLDSWGSKRKAIKGQYIGWYVELYPESDIYGYYLTDEDILYSLKLAFTATVGRIFALKGTGARPVIQNHHWIPHSNKLNFMNHPLVKQANVNIKDYVKNVGQVANHQGRHTREYSNIVNDILNKHAIRVTGQGQAAAQRALDAAIKEIISKVKDGSLKLYNSKEVWIP